jgi:hypothetical protein
MESLREKLYETLEVDNPMTVRQVFYRLVSAGVIEKTDNAYDAIDRILVQMRRSDDLPYAWLTDSTRWMRKPRTYSSAEAALQNTVQCYRRAIWNEQDVYLEIWVEKDALAGILFEETSKWDVPLMVTRGFPSLSYIYEAAEAISAEDKPTYLYYFGDFDPSGVRIPRTTEKQLRELAPDADIHFERVAVTEEQIELLGLPTRPTKKKGNTHANGWDGESVEVDAIPPAQLRSMVRQCIELHVDHRVLEITKAAEQSERELLKQWVGRLIAEKGGAA